MPDVIPCERFLSRALSQLVHCPCCICCTASWTLLESSLSRMSLMTMSLLSFPSAFDHHFVVDDPCPLQSVRVFTITSLILRHSLAWTMASSTHSISYQSMVGCTVFKTRYSESCHIIFFQDGF